MDAVSERENEGGKMSKFKIKTSNAKTARVLVRVHNEDLRKVKELSKKHGVHMADITSQMIKFALENLESDEK